MLIDHGEDFGLLYQTSVTPKSAVLENSFAQLNISELQIHFGRATAIINLMGFVLPGLAGEVFAHIVEKEKISG